MSEMDIEKIIASPPEELDKFNRCDVNQVELYGKVTQLFTMDNFASLTVATGRSGSTDRMHINFSDAICFGEVAKFVSENIKKGDFVKVVGHIKTRNTREIKKIKKFKRQEICADMIEKPNSLMENYFGVDGDVYENPRSVLLLTGTVIDIRSPYDGILTLALGVRDERGKTSRIETSYYTRDVASVVEKIKIGDRVACVGYIESSKNASGYHENYVIKNIAIKEGD